MTAITNEPIRAAARPRTDGFYLSMAVACAAVAFLGFAPTYWAPMVQGALKANPIVHIHGMVFFAWALFFVFQTWLAASGRIGRHRMWGFLGVSFATAMTMLGTLAAINTMKNSAAINQAYDGMSFAIVPLSGIAFFAATVAFAIVNVRKPDVHKRAMLLAAISILDAPVARWFLVLLAPPGPPGPPPVAATIPPAITAYLLLLIAMVFDWRVRGKPHAVYVVGGIALLAIKMLNLPVSTTAAWHAIAGWMLSLAT
jgi:hypothetical protein